MNPIFGIDEPTIKNCKKTHQHPKSKNKPSNKMQLSSIPGYHDEEKLSLVWQVLLLFF